MGEEDVDNNVISIKDFIDDSGNIIESDTFTLPADAWRDQETLEWLMSKGGRTESVALLDDFNDLVSSKFQVKIDSYSSMSALQVLAEKEKFNLPKSSQAINNSIEKGD